MAFDDLARRMAESRGVRLPDHSSPEQLEAAARRATGAQHILTGVLMLVLGVGVSGLSYTIAAPGGVYYVATGLIVFGVLVIGEGIRVRREKPAAS